MLVKPLDDALLGMLVALVCVTHAGAATPPQASDRFPQEVAESFTQADGLPSDDILRVGAGC